MLAWNAHDKRTTGYALPVSSHDVMTDWDEFWSDSNDERDAWPRSVMSMRIDDDAVWEDLCDEDEWTPLQLAVQNLATLARSPQMIGAASLDLAHWNGAHANVLYELERLHVLLLARQLSDALKGEAWEEPLASLLRGLDLAVSSALQTSRALAIEMNGETLVESVDEGTVGEADATSASAPEQSGRGYAYLLHRRFIAELQSVLDLRAAVCQEAYEE